MDVNLFNILQDVQWEAKKKHIYIKDLPRVSENLPNDKWEATLKGDCEDFALWCKLKLKRMGIKSDLVKCFTENNTGHMVCHVEGWILDNRHRWVMRSDDLPYKWLSIGKPDGNWYLVAK